MGFDCVRNSIFGVCAFAIPFLCKSLVTLYHFLVFNDTLQVIGKRIRAASQFATEFELEKVIIV